MLQGILASCIESAVGKELSPRFRLTRRRVPPRNRANMHGVDSEGAHSGLTVATTMLA
jgi:hypothetical protein